MTGTDVALLGDLRAVVAAAYPLAATLDRVSTLLAARPDALEALVDRRSGHPDADVRSEILHAESGFSVVALTLPPATQTAVHDHLTWCVVAVVRGREHETTYRDHGDHLTELEHSTNPTGSVTALAPPGDIHRVRNDTDGTAVSLHVYGADLRAAGSSVRRVYELPVRGSGDTQRSTSTQVSSSHAPV